MELTRRDALAALTATGITAGVGVLAGGSEPPRAGAIGTESDGGASESETAPGLSTPLFDLLEAAAEVLYPDEVDGHRAFVETYVLGRIDDRETYRDGVREAAAQLDAVARDWHGRPYADLDVTARDQLLRNLGVETAEPDPAGTISDRIRFYIVNDLLFAFYTTPTGGRLVGIENPIGYPGGLESYQRGSMPPAGETTDGGESDG
ncbi:MAG: gluconate 2-dehydrogenase subunit 3 family protein [Haloquadratum sp.]